MRRRAWVLTLVGLQLGGLALTFPLKTLGTAGWHHIASLLVLLAALIPLKAQMTSRRFLGIGVLATSVLATVSGFFLLYWKEGIRADGYQDWGVFWHVAWSWAAAIFFWQHTWVNRTALRHFFRSSWRRIPTATLHGAFYVILVGAFAATAGPAKSLFTAENYVPLSYWSWLAATSLAYAAWLVLRRWPHARLPARAAVDLGLVPVAAVAVVSGLPLLFLDPQMDAWGLKYASKLWHVIPSVGFSVLVFVHSLQLWSAVRTQWRQRPEIRPKFATGIAPARR